MSIDKAIESLKASLDANTAALLAHTEAMKSGKAATSVEETKPASKGGRGSKATEKTGPKHTQAEMNAALIKLKDEHGLEHAKAILKEHGYEKMGDVKEADFDKVFDAAEAKYAELSEGGGDDGL